MCRKTGGGAGNANKPSVGIILVVKFAVKAPGAVLEYYQRCLVFSGTCSSAIPEPRVILSISPSESFFDTLTLKYGMFLSLKLFMFICFRGGLNRFSAFAYRL